VLLVVALAGCGEAEQAQSSATVQASASANTAECPPVEGSSERVTRFSAPPPMCIDPA
jgi:hypothetical protein